MRLLAMVILAAFVSCESKKDCRKHVINFAGENWVFPTTIGEADQQHNFSFYPPAYYHKKLGNAGLVILDFEEGYWDYVNERQKKDHLFSRNVNTYIFQIRRTEGTYDSLKRSIENVYHKKFQLIKGQKTPSKYNQKERRPFKHYLLKVDNCLTIGIKNSCTSNYEDIVTVHFLYGLTLGDIGIAVGNY